MSAATSMTSPAAAVIVLHFQQHRRPPSPVFSNLGTYSHPGLRLRHQSGNLGTYNLQPSSSGRCRSLPSKQTHCQRRASIAHLPTNELKSPNGIGLLTFIEMPDVINTNGALMIGNAEADSVADTPHSAADFFCSRSSTSSTVLSPQPRVTLPDLLEGAISCFLPRHRSASSLDTDLQSISCFLTRHRSISSLNTDLLEGAISCFLPRHRSVIDLLPPPLIEIYFLDTDL
ncbi:hypothetical protein B296_00018993 [Ensete ventricosum]|uniref:Uncharacterized protein n=1 Tax=Ensete ventricosum TaxID=4639 RepID=A0A426ZAI2_ENSVE|nr:hypothetical protein B296_00018993 [Ensete ventricosum]